VKIIGFSAGSTGREGNVDRMVKAVLEKSGHEFEFVKLTDMNFSGCKGCVQLCANPQVCKLEDDALPYYQKVKDADAVVIGTPVYFDTIKFQSKVPPCFKCGRHKECEIGGLYMMLGDPAKELTITKEMFTRWEDDSATAAAVDAAAEKLANI